MVQLHSCAVGSGATVQACSGATVQRCNGATVRRCRRCSRCLPSVSLQKSWMERELIERKPCAKYTMAQHSRKGAPKAWRCRPSQVCAGGAALVRAALATALARGLEGDFERGAGLEGDLERGDRLAGDSVILLERAGDEPGYLERVVDIARDKVCVRVAGSGCRRRLYRTLRWRQQGRKKGCQLAVSAI